MEVDQRSRNQTVEKEKPTTQAIVTDLELEKETHQLALKEAKERMLDLERESGHLLAEWRSVFDMNHVKGVVEHSPLFEPRSERSQVDAARMERKRSVREEHMESTPFHNEWLVDHNSSSSSHHRSSPSRM